MILQWFNFMFMAIMGVATALDTLGSQAFGANDKAMVLSWALTSSVAMGILALPIAIGLWMSDWAAVVLFLQPPDIAQVLDPAGPKPPT